MELVPALEILEKAIGFSVEGQRNLLEQMKKRIIESKIPIIKFD